MTADLQWLTTAAIVYEGAKVSLQLAAETLEQKVREALAAGATVDQIVDAAKKVGANAQTERTLRALTVKAER